jgi:hypothetical protein
MFTASIVAALIACSLPGGEPEARSASRDRAKTVPKRLRSDAPRVESGAESPEALISKFLMSIAEGKPSVTASCFDKQAEEPGKEESAGWQCVAKASAAYKEAQRAATKKFGTAGAEAVDAVMDDDPFHLRRSFDAVKAKAAIDKGIPIEREGADSAIAGDSPMHRNASDGRWYMTPVGEPWDPVALMLVVEGGTWTEALQGVPKAVDDSASPEQLKQKIKESVDAVSSRIERQIKQQIKQSLDEAEHKKNGKKTAPPRSTLPKP